MKACPRNPLQIQTCKTHNTSRPPADLQGNRRREVTQRRNSSRKIRARARPGGWGQAFLWTDAGRIPQSLQAHCAAEFSPRDGGAAVASLSEVLLRFCSLTAERIFGNLAYRNSPGEMKEPRLALVSLSATPTARLVKQRDQKGCLHRSQVTERVQKPSWLFRMLRTLASMAPASWISSSMHRQPDSHEYYTDLKSCRSPTHKIALQRAFSSSSSPLGQLASSATSDMA